MKDSYCKLPFTCGNGSLNIDYPFGHDVTGYYCGYPGLKIKCTDEKPVISLANRLYYVKNLDYSIRRLLTVVGMDVEGKECPRPTQSMNMTDNIGLPTPLYVVANFNTSIFYNCSNFLPNVSHISCLEFRSTKRSYAFSGENPLPNFNWYKNCEKNVVLPLLTTRSAYLDKLGFLTDSNYTSTLQMGFRLGWSTPSNCTYCESAGGLCSISEATNDLTCAHPSHKVERSWVRNTSTGDC
ncbi:hypothetical protein AQUCO_01100431v1 [Aquilegia coerulea]|uniref:Wall-associated receptor kinase galacturonan-binding domain-containing protein n=1 Tax=Aquilegia coerulea TaxID=218851 RepID=A0A2G5E716_AQUCA|nr:hypothetical protein AQUCO_01100431v1 [Aquilegia coerulea]